MKYSNNCINLVKKYEGLYLYTYKCASDILTIGYGHTKDVKINQTCTKEQAEKWLIKDLDESYKYVVYYANMYNFKFNQNQIDSLTSFTFNCGCGNLRKLLQSSKTVTDVGNKLLNYNKNAYGTVLSGLVKRRNEENKLFFLQGGENIMFDTVKKGDKNVSVGILQLLLGVTPDSIFGQKTYVALVNYQRNNNLVIDGVCGQNTWKSILKKRGFIS